MSDARWFSDVSIVNHSRPQRGSLLTATVVFSFYLQAESLHTESILVEQTTFTVDVYDGRRTVRNIVIDYSNPVLLDLYRSQVDVDSPNFDFWNYFNP